MATVADIGFIVHDWIFSAAHFKASLFLPIALERISASDSSQDELERKNKRAICLLITYQVICIVTTIAWIISSICLQTF